MINGYKNTLLQVRLFFASVFSLGEPIHSFWPLRRLIFLGRNSAYKKTSKCLKAIYWFDKLSKTT